MKPRVLLIAPPVYDFALFDLFLKPFGLLTLGRAFEKSGYDVSFINGLDYTDRESIQVMGRPRRHANGTGKFFRQIAAKPPVLGPLKRNYARYGLYGPVLENQIAAQQPDLVLITSGMTYWYPGVVEVVRYVRKHHPAVPVIIGGIYATLCTAHCKQVTGADHVIAGPAFPGIEAVLQTHSLPVPQREVDADPLILPELYSDAGVIRLNRGCPFDCQYCASKTLHPRFKKGRPLDTYHLVHAIHTSLGTTSFAFYDDALLFQKEELFLPFLRQIIDSGLSLSFYLPNGIHLRYLDRQTAFLMKKAGFKDIRIGFESSDPLFHQTIDSKFEIDGSREKIEILKSAGFLTEEIGLYILAGLPGQEKEEVVESVQYASKLGARIYIAEYSPVPGSPLWEKSVALSPYPLETEPLTHNNTFFPMEWERFTRADLEEVKTLARELSR